MATFNQQGQIVQYQYNAGGDINFGAIRNRTQAAAELRKLIPELASAVKADALDKETAIEIKSKIKKAAVEAEKSQPDKKSILDHIKDASTIVQGLKSGAGLVTGLAEAAEMIGRLF